MGDKNDFVRPISYSRDMRCSQVDELVDARQALSFSVQSLLWQREGIL